MGVSYIFKKIKNIKSNSIMKKTLSTILLSTLVVFGFSQNKVIPNPASLYVKFLGYKSEVRVDSSGNQSRVCVFPDNTECDEWLFFRGICGQKFSYCTRKGCQIETESTETAQYAVCVCIDSLGNKVKIHLNDFMNQHGDTLFKESKIVRRR
jgi:putative hemolysin